MPGCSACKRTRLHTCIGFKDTGTAKRNKSYHCILQFFDVNAEGKSKALINFL